MIVLTSTKEKCIEIENKFPEKNFFHFPCIEYTDPQDGFKAVDAAIRINHLYEWVIFLSPKAADVYFTRLLAIGGNFFNLSNHLKFGVIGESTKRFIEEEINMPVDFMPSEASSEIFIKEFCLKYQYGFDCGFKVLLPRSELAHDDFKEKFEASKNYVLDIVPAYNTIITAKNDAERKELLEKLDKFESIVFTSSSCVDNFFKLCPDVDLSNVRVHSIGSKTSKSFYKYRPSHKHLTTANLANLDSLLSTLC